MQPNSTKGNKMNKADFQLFLMTEIKTAIEKENFRTVELLATVFEKTK